MSVCLLVQVLCTGWQVLRTGVGADPDVVLVSVLLVLILVFC
jgi:hypothetical protein